MLFEIRPVDLRFNPLNLPGKETFWAPVGLFYRRKGEPGCASVFIEMSNKTPDLPVILSWPNVILPYDTDLAVTDLGAIELCLQIKGDFLLGPISEIDVPDGTKKIDKWLFTQIIAEHEKHQRRRPIYRFSPDFGALTPGSDADPRRIITT